MHLPEKHGNITELKVGQGDGTEPGKNCKNVGRIITSGKVHPFEEENLWDNWHR